jgi:prevent-host-death family protein
MRKEWQLQEAKNRFSEIVEKALSQGPQTVTRRGQRAVVIISFEDYQKLVGPKETLVSFLRKSPLSGVGLDLKRSTDYSREVEL